MATDWQTIRGLMSAAIDFAEMLERKGFCEKDRALVIQTGGQSISLYDLMVSAHTLPEALRYHIIRQRHEKGDDAPYISETARLLKAMGEACAELVGAAGSKPANKQILETISWYRTIAPRLLEKSSMRNRNKSAFSDGTQRLFSKERVSSLPEITTWKDRYPSFTKQTQF